MCKLSIQKPFSEQVIVIEWVRIESPTGDFIVGPGHQPLLSLVKPESEVIYNASGKEYTLVIGAEGGIAHVDPSGIRLVLG